jgi:hypothetical protein
MVASSFVDSTEYGNNSERICGRIVVHDRKQIEKEVLPRYFNHSSFASLRRQLNYFAFVRLGRGRQKGATYFNDNVMVLEDILRLKRVVPDVIPREDINEMPTSSPCCSRDDRRSVHCTDVLQHPRKCLRLCNNISVVRTSAHSTVPTTKDSIHLKKRRLSYDHPAVQTVSPSESGDEEGNASSYSTVLVRFQGWKNTRDTCASLKEQISDMPLSENERCHNVSHYSLQNEELIVCAALVNMGQAQKNITH